MSTCVIFNVCNTAFDSERSLAESHGLLNEERVIVQMHKIDLRLFIPNSHFRITHVSSYFYVSLR